ncbi:MAG TPA: translation elongation factor Ts [Patescibacteria group bacterium]|nr:translation elongation factor Ts [Patescibacteria group bacterium]
MKISLDQIKQLRDKTRCSIADCKEALEQAGGDMDRALKLMVEKGAKILDKKSHRQTKNGLVASYIHSDKKIGVLLELVCETDFAAKTDDFQNLGRELTMQIAATDPADVKTLLTQPFIKDESAEVSDLVKEAATKIRENIKINRFCRYQI